MAIRIFFRRVEVHGAETVDLESPAVFVLNHPNGLVDPVFLLCLSPRPVSFLAKEPLFRMPVIGYLVRKMDALPVYRQQDQGADTSRNKQTFAAAINLLLNGGAVAVCPEGVSHDEPRLKPIKSGAARIALGAASRSGSKSVLIIPAGLYYTAKTVFRSEALLLFGDAINVEARELGPDGEPSRQDVSELSSRIELALREVMLHAEHEEALAVVQRAEKIFSSELPGDDDDVDSPLRELELRKIFLRSYSVLSSKMPEKISAMDHRIRRFENQLKLLNLESDELETPESASREIAQIIANLAYFAIVTPFAVVGTVIHYPAYHLAGAIARRLSRESEDVVSTIKIIAAMLFFPVTWVVIGALVAYGARVWVGLLAVMILPLTGYIAIRFWERLDEFIADVRALTFYLTRRRFFLHLVNERKAIHREIMRLGVQAGELGEEMEH